MESFIDGRLLALVGDITEERVDAIVNAANSTLLGGGGVDGVIHREGGPSILAECRDIRLHHYPDGLPPGKAVITGGGSLPAGYVIHTVGPVWHDGGSGESETLATAYRNCLKLASETGVKTIAFPAISTGMYGFPRDVAAPIVYRTVEEYLSRKSMPREVRLVFHTAEDLSIFLTAVRSLNG